MDETAFPILLLDLLRREAAPGMGKLERWWPMVRSAASFILRNGPVTQQDRWEEEAGYSPFTLAAEVSALLAGGRDCRINRTPRCRLTLRDTADAWNDNIERWVYATGGDLAQQVGVDGYYVRIAPPDSDGSGVADARLRSDQEPPAGRKSGTGAPYHQSRRAGAGAIRIARPG